MIVFEGGVYYELVRAQRLGLGREDPDERLSSAGEGVEEGEKGEI